MAVVFSAPVTTYPHYHQRGLVVVSATNSDSAFPATNLFTYDPTQVYRTTSGSTVITIQLTGTGNTYVDTIALIHSNVSYRATLKIETSPDGSAWTTRFDSAFWANLASVQSAYAGVPMADTDPRRHSLERNLSYYHSLSLGAIAITHVRLTVTDPLVSNITIGRLFLGRSFVPTYGHQYGSTFTFQDYGKSERTDRGVLNLEPGRIVQGATVKMDFLTKKEMFDFSYDFNKFIGRSRDFLVCLDTTDIEHMQKNTLYCTISEGRTISFDSFNTHSQNWVLESIGG